MNDSPVALFPETVATKPNLVASSKFSRIFFELAATSISGSMVEVSVLEPTPPSVPPNVPAGNAELVEAAARLSVPFSDDTSGAMGCSDPPGGELVLFEDLPALSARKGGER